MAINLINPDDGSMRALAPGGTTPFIIHPDRGAYFNPANYVQMFDDFLGDTLNADWSGAAGADGQAVAPAVTSSGISGGSGVVRLTSGDVGDTMANDGSSLTKYLNWRASNGGLYMEARVVLRTSVSNVCVNVGFTDVLATSTLEMPFTISGTTITSNASDAACFVFDTAQTNDFWHIQGVKADTDTAINNTAVAPTADTYTKLAIAIDSSGNAEFFINDQSYGTVANAVTSTVALTPIIAVTARTTTSRIVEADYVLVTQKRA